MVKKIEEENQISYQCEECKFHYLDESLAQKCQNWCQEHKSCNLKIIKDAIENRK